MCAEFAKECAHKWKDLTQEKKDYYHKLSKDDKKRYELELAIYKKRMLSLIDEKEIEPKMVNENFNQLPVHLDNVVDNVFGGQDVHTMENGLLNEAMILPKKALVNYNNLNIGQSTSSNDTVDCFVETVNVSNQPGELFFNEGDDDVQTVVENVHDSLINEEKLESKEAIINMSDVQKSFEANDFQDDHNVDSVIEQAENSLITEKLLENRTVVEDFTCPNILSDNDIEALFPSIDDENIEVSDAYPKGKHKRFSMSGDIDDLAFDIFCSEEMPKVRQMFAPLNRRMSGEQMLDELILRWESLSEELKDNYMSKALEDENRND